MKKIPFLDESLYRLHHLIKTKTTGTPTQLAKKLSCSESTLFGKIKLLRDKGLPIEYCKVRNCYFYDGDVSIDFVVTINGKEAQRIMGGGTINHSNSFSPPWEKWLEE